MFIGPMSLPLMTFCKAAALLFVLYSGCSFAFFRRHVYSFRCRTMFERSSADSSRAEDPDSVVLKAL